jgi:hypothetical protein
MSEFFVHSNTTDVKCAVALANLTLLYHNTYEKLDRIQIAYSYSGYLTSVFAIVAGLILLVKMNRNRTGFVSYIVVSLQVIDGLVAFICTFLQQYFWRHHQRSVHEVLVLVAISFYIQALMNISDFVFATQYLISSLQLGGEVSVTKPSAALYAWLFAMISIILGCAIYISLTIEHFVLTKVGRSDWASLYCTLMETKKTND